MGETKIEWAEAVWNPTTGCTRVSEGCRHCYAETLAAGRLKHLPEYAGTTTNGRWNGTLKLHEDRLDAPRRWRKPRRIFVNSMSDLFHEAVPNEFLVRCWRIMAECQQHTFIILTKRPSRMAEFVRWWAAGDSSLPNVWLGTSVEDQPSADDRIPHLLTVPAAVRFLSVEPMLDAIDLQHWMVDKQAASWLIVGGESGSGARPMDLGWVRDLIADCHDGRGIRAAKIFVKQLGSVWARENGARHRKGGDPSEWPGDLRLREWPN